MKHLVLQPHQRVLVGLQISRPQTQPFQPRDWEQGLGICLLNNPPRCSCSWRSRSHSENLSSANQGVAELEGTPASAHQAAGTDRQTVEGLTVAASWKGRKRKLRLLGLPFLSEAGQSVLRQKEPQEGSCGLSPAPNHQGGEELARGPKPPLCPRPLQVNRVCACFPSGMV